MSETKNPAADRGSLVSDGEAAIRECRHAWSELLDALGIDPANGPAHVARALESDVKSAWMLVHLTEQNESVDLLQRGRFVPGPRTSSRILRGLAGHDVPQSTTAAVERASRGFQELLKRHTRDRGSFDLLLAGAAGSDPLQAELEQRRAALRSNSYLFGLRAGLQLKTVVLARSKTESDRVDAAVVAGFAELQRIREHVPWRLVSAHSIDDHGEVTHNARVTPLDPAVEPGAPPLMLDFCEPGAPDLEPLGSIGGATEFGLRPVEPSARQRETCVVGEMMRSIEPRFRTEEHRTSAVTMRLHTPCEEAVLDIFLERGLLGSTPQYSAQLYSGLFAGRQLGPFLPQDRLTLHETVEGPIPSDSTHLPSLPRYDELLDRLFERGEWERERFELYRLRIPFPIVPTAVLVDAPLERR